MHASSKGAPPEVDVISETEVKRVFIDSAVFTNDTNCTAQNRQKLKEKLKLNR